ncbi:hypothetical protein GCM10023324_10330 [Streptomyces youssoufiensis]
MRVSEQADTVVPEQEHGGEDVTGGLAEAGRNAARGETGRAQGERPYGTCAPSRTTGVGNRLTEAGSAPSLGAEEEVVPASPVPGRAQTPHRTNRDAFHRTVEAAL